MRFLTAMLSRSSESVAQRQHCRARRSTVDHREKSRRRRLFLEHLEDRRLLATFMVLNTADSGAGSLRQAITDANNNIGSDVIHFDSGAHGTILLTSGELPITDPVDVQGPGANVLTINGNNASRIFNISANSSVSGVRIANANSNTGSILNSATLIVSQSTFEGNLGGSIDNSGILTVSACRFIANTGASYVALDLSGNPYATHRPGGIYNSGTLTVSHSEFAGNVGGSIYNSGTLDISDSTFIANTGATFQDPNLPTNDPYPAYTIPVGSGVYNTNRGVLTVSGSVFSNNIGSGIFNYYIPAMGTPLTKVTITGSTFSGNKSGSGGGILSLGGDVTVNNSTLTNNIAEGLQYAAGGGICLYQGGVLSVSNSTFVGNQAIFGGGISASFGVSAKISNSTFSGNHAHEIGGGIFHTVTPTLTLNNSILANNTAVIASTANLGSFSTRIGSHNLIEGWNGAGLTGTITADPNLGPLANYGGPTWTMPLLPGSPAINAGNASVPGGVPATDQRGMPRINGGNIDIGAFETSGAGLVVVGTSLGDAISLSPGSDANTLKTTINGVVTDNIAVEGLVYVQSLSGSDNITVTNSLAGHVVVDGGNDSDAYTITFGNLAGTVAVADRGTSGNDALTVNGTDTADTLAKNAGVIKWRPTGAPEYIEEIDFDGMEGTTLNAGAGNDTILDPNSGDLLILGGPGDDTITVAENIGLVTVDGGEGSDSYIIQSTSSYLISRQFIGHEGAGEYIIQAGDPQGPISIHDSGAVGADAVTVEGTSEADEITQKDDAIVANGATITLVGADTLAVDGGGGTGDTFTVVGTPTVPATVKGVNDMVIAGTSGNDQILFIPGNSAGQVVAKLNGVVVASFSPAGRIIAYGLAGNDDIQVAGGVTHQAWLYGDSGNDRLNAGNGGSLLFGGDGNDQLIGGGGRDIMIGGNGADSLLGNGNDDILVAGYTHKDDRALADHDAFWRAVVAEWNSASLFASRVQNLKVPGGLLPQVVDDCFDDEMDFLNGSGGDDWLIYALGEDKVTGHIEASN